MAFTQAQIDALREALATGTTRVRYGDKDVTYRSLDEMERLLQRMEAEVGGTTETPRATCAYVCRD